ncbi:hypothetical protein JCM10207_004960 [Rhodosporidiobolus poonsookiae]
MAPLSRLEKLPYELQLVIVAHLPPRVDSIRPSDSLLPLALASTTLHRTFEPLLHETLRFSTPTQAQRFFDSAPRRLLPFVRRLTLLRPPKHAPPWTLDDLARLLDALSGLRELQINGGALAAGSTASSVLAVVARAPSCPLLTSLELDLESPASGGASGLSHTHTLPWTTNARADHPQPVHAAPLEDDRRPLSPSRSLPSRDAEPCFLLSLLEAFPALSHVRLANLCASALFYPARETGSSSPVLLRLRSLELEAVELSDQALVHLSQSTSETLEALTLRRCKGFSRGALVAAIQSCGARLRRLDLDAGPSTPPSPSPTTPPTSPQRSPLSRAATTPLLASSAFVGVLDAVLPSLSSLTHLTSTGALFSPALLGKLGALTPHLRHLAVVAHPHVGAADLVPLVQPAHLPSLQRLELHAHSFTSTHPAACLAPPWLSTPSNAAPTDTLLLELCTAALARNLDLVGAVFEATQERLDWAEREARREAEKAGVGEGERRRRKRPGVARA